MRQVPQSTVVTGVPCVVPVGSAIGAGQNSVRRSRRSPQLGVPRRQPPRGDRWCARTGRQGLIRCHQRQQIDVCRQRVSNRIGDDQVGQGSFGGINNCALRNCRGHQPVGSASANQPSNSGIGDLGSLGTSSRSQFTPSALVMIVPRDPRRPRRNRGCAGHPKASSGSVQNR